MGRVNSGLIGAMIINHKSIMTEIEGRPEPAARRHGKGLGPAFGVQPASKSFDPNDPLNVFRRKINNEEINHLPARQYAGEIILVKDKEAVTEAVQALKKETVLGFDTETRPVFSKGKQNNPPALLQLAGESSVYVFQLSCIGFCAEIASLLEDEVIVKTGVAVRDDIRELQRLHPFKPGGFVDLSQIAKQNHLETHGLRNMAANFFGLRIPKGARCSNWAVKNLTHKQLLYAATDAWIGRELYIEMRKKGLEF